MAISFVGAADWSEPSDDTTYTLTKPTGVLSGDVMFAILGMDLFSDNGNDTTVTAPSGWTVVNGNVYSPPNLQMAIFKRTAGSSEPGSWNGTLSSSRGPKATTVVAYRNITGVAISSGADVQNFNSTGSTTSLGTGTVNNPSNTNWRLVLGAYTSSSVNYTLTSNEVTKRSGEANSNIEVGAWDSNGTIATGNTSRTINRGQVWESAAVYIAILDATDGVNVDGTLGATLPMVTMTASGSLSYDGTLAVTVAVGPQVSMEGIASPPEGPLAATVMPVVSIDAATAARGTVDINAGPIVNIVAETRFFGTHTRVVTPEAESRVVKPKLGPAD